MSEHWRGALLAEFAEPAALLAAVRAAHEAGYRRIDAFTPFPLDELTEALDLDEGWLAWLGSGAFVVGGAAGYLLQWYLNAIDYPLNVGGRPLAAWPAFTLPAFEIAVLFAACATVLAMLIKNRLPRLHHPLFDVDRFALVSRDRFFLGIASSDPLFEPQATRLFLAELQPCSIERVPE